MSIPGERLDSGNITGAATKPNEWVPIDVSEENISITEGGFFVSMYWLKSPGATCENPVQTVRLDSTEPIDGRTLLKWGAGGEWTPLSDTSDGDHDAMIRAIVGDCILIGKDLSMPIPSAIYNGTEYGSTLGFYSNPNDPSVYYWKMDKSTLVVK